MEGFIRDLGAILDLLDCANEEVLFRVVIVLHV